VGPGKRNDDVHANPLRERRRSGALSKYCGTDIKLGGTNSCLLSEKGHPGDRSTEPRSGPLLRSACSRFHPILFFRDLNSDGQTHHYNETRPDGPSKKASTSWLKPWLSPSGPRAATWCSKKKFGAPQEIHQCSGRSRSPGDRTRGSHREHRAWPDRQVRSKKPNDAAR